MESHKDQHLGLCFSQINDLTLIINSESKPQIFADTSIIIILHQETD